MKVVPLDKDVHAQVQALLPWYVSAQLDDDDVRMVQEHVRTCARCSSELESERAVQGGSVGWEVADAGSPDTAAHRRAAGAADTRGVDAGLQRMAMRIRNLEPEPIGPADPRSLRGALPGWRWVALLQGAAIVLLLGLVASGRFGAGHADGAAAYRALSAASPAAQEQALIMFLPDATERQLREALQACQASIVHGPTASHAYVLRLDDAAGSTVAPIACLRGQAVVRMAEPLAPAALQAPARP